MFSSILVVDDDEEVRKMLSAILEDGGYSVETAKNGGDAVKICKKFSFDAALVDIELPDIKGIELLGILKKIRPKMVKIIITGHPSLENAVKAVNEKADGYVLKPFKVELLLELISKLLAEKKNEYFSMFREVEEAKKNTPIFKYNQPDKWR